jgi:hypothetical protein
MKENENILFNEEQENNDSLCRHKDKWQGKVTSANIDERLTERVDQICLGLNYHLVKYTWTSSFRLKERHMRSLVGLYFRLKRFLKLHPSFVLNSMQKDMVRSVQTVIRLYFNEGI